jgi:hypothetical protein
MQKKLFFLASILFFYSCDSTIENGPEQEQKITETNLLDFKNELLSNLNDLGDQLREIDATFDDMGVVRAIVENQASYCSMSIKEFDSAIEKLPLGVKTKSAVAVEQTCITPYQALKIAEIDRMSNESNSPTEFISSLETLKEEVLLERTSESEKQLILILITSQQASVDFINKNQDLFNYRETGLKSSSWWSSWGKCAASIVGGAITVGTTGLIGGAAVGTIVLPVVGSVSGAVVGAVGGAIGGALTGAVAGCDGERGGGELDYHIEQQVYEANILDGLCIEDIRITEKVPF